MVHLAIRYVRDLAMVAVTDLRVMEVDDNFSTHALIDQDGGRVRVISADADWIPRRMRGYPIAAE